MSDASRSCFGGSLPQGAVCVLGCRPGSAALARRARAARDVFFEGCTSASSSPSPSPSRLLIVACGGAAHEGQVEADALARMLRDGGVPEELIIRERASRDTQENATFASRILLSRGVTDVVVVTCSWHLPRATKLFTRAGLRVVQGVGAPPPRPTLASRAWWAARERVSTWKDFL